VPNCDEDICGTDGYTADGTTLTKDTRSVAVDPKLIPLGSKLLVGGKFYIANDVGGGIDNYSIDIMVYGKTHQEVLAMGTKEVKVKLLKGI
jgi:3D (Asp-Asp-Asp) domain-containing protein